MMISQQNDPTDDDNNEKMNVIHNDEVEDDDNNQQIDFYPSSSSSFYGESNNNSQFMDDMNLIDEEESDECDESSNSTMKIRESSSSDLTNGCISTDLEGEQKKRKKKNTKTRRPSFKPQYMVGLRIFRTDIRRKYPTMYANVMNSLDPEMIYQFFSNFCSPDFIYERRRDEVTAVNEFSTVLAPKPVIGRSQFVQAFLTFFTPTILSDMVTRITNPRVIVTKGIPGSRIIMDDISELSILYSVKRIPVSESSSTELSQPLPAPGFEVIDPNTNDRICFTLLPSPFRIKLEAEVVLHMNESNLITATYITQKHF